MLEGLDSLAGAYAWASIWESEGDAEQAATAFRRAIVHDTSATDEARYQLGLFLVRTEQYQEARAVFTEILTRPGHSPDDAIVLYQLGKADLLLRRHLDEAARCFRRYLASPVPPGGASPAMAHYRLGQVFDLQGKRDSALIELRRARELQPRNQVIAWALRDVERRR
jgi:tetratricopeptide (TPR) repeat protein